MVAFKYSDGYAPDSDGIENRIVCAATFGKYINQGVKLRGRVIHPVEPGQNVKVKLYSGPGNIITVTADLDTRLDYLVDFIGIVTSPTTMQADSYYVYPTEFTHDFDLDAYCEALKFSDETENPWNSD